MTNTTVIRLLEESFPQAVITWDQENYPDTIICTILQQDGDRHRILVCLPWLVLEHNTLDRWDRLEDEFEAYNWNDLLGWVACVREDIGPVEQDKWDWATNSPSGLAMLPNLCRLCWEEPPQENVGNFERIWLNGATYKAPDVLLHILLLRPGDSKGAAQILDVTGKFEVVMPDDLLNIEEAAAKELKLERKIQRTMRNLETAGTLVSGACVSSDIYQLLSRDFITGGAWIRQDATLPIGTILYKDIHDHWINPGITLK